MRPWPTPRSSRPPPRRRPTAGGTRSHRSPERRSVTHAPRFPLMSEQLPLVIGLGVVDPGLVAETFTGRCRFAADPTDDDLREAHGAIARADATIDTALLDRAPRLRVVARTGVGVERVDVDAATARGIAVVVTPGTGATAVAEGAIAMAMHLVKRFGRLTTLVRSGQWAARGTVP